MLQLHIRVNILYCHYFLFIFAFFTQKKKNEKNASYFNYIFWQIFKLATSIGSSISRVSSNSPSSTPTDSDSHPGPQVLQISQSSNQQQKQHIVTSGPNSTHEEDIAPPIASRPERTKSIVSLFKLVNYK